MLDRPHEEGTIVDEVTRAGGAAPASARMQALLSQAVEEQVAGQRAVSTELAGLRAQVASLADLVGARPTAGPTAGPTTGPTASPTTGPTASPTTGDLGRLQETVAALVDDVRAAMTRLDGRFDALDARLSSLIGRVGEQPQSAATGSLAPSDPAGAPRPVVRREPVVEVTPDLDEQVEEPVRTAASSWLRPDRSEPAQPTGQPWWRPTD